MNTFGSMIFAATLAFAAVAAAVTPVGAQTAHISAATVASSSVASAAR